MYIHDLASGQVLVYTPTPMCILVSHPQLFLLALVVVLRMIRPKTLLGLDVDTWDIINIYKMSDSSINVLQYNNGIVHTNFK